MYSTLNFITALAVTTSTIITSINTISNADSSDHYLSTVGYFKGVEKYAIRADSSKLVELTPNLSEVERNAMSKNQKWFLTEHYAKVVKLPKAKRITFLNQ